MNPQTSRPPSYLVRNLYSYCFQDVVPIDLQQYYLIRKELCYPLRIGYLAIYLQNIEQDS